MPDNQTQVLVAQPSAAPTRKWNYGAIGSALVVAVITALTVYDANLGATWGPVLAAIAGGLGFAVPAYVVKNVQPNLGV